MGVVNAFNEWDPLEEIIVGRVDGARIPRPTGPHALDVPRGAPTSPQIPSGRHQRIIDETVEDSSTRSLPGESSLGIVVRRPEPCAHERVFRSLRTGRAMGTDYCPRDACS